MHNKEVFGERTSSRHYMETRAAWARPILWKTVESEEVRGVNVLYLQPFRAERVCLTPLTFPGNDVRKSER
jgi:hypothetical protein